MNIFVTQLQFNAIKQQYNTFIKNDMTQKLQINKTLLYTHTL